MIEDDFLLAAQAADIDKCKEILDKVLSVLPNIKYSSKMRKDLEYGLKFGPRPRGFDINIMKKSASKVNIRFEINSIVTTNANKNTTRWAVIYVDKYIFVRTQSYKQKFAHRWNINEIGQHNNWITELIEWINESKAEEPPVAKQLIPNLIIELQTKYPKIGFRYRVKNDNEYDVWVKAGKGCKVYRFSLNVDTMWIWEHGATGGTVRKNAIQYELNNPNSFNEIYKRFGQDIKEFLEQEYQDGASTKRELQRRLIDTERNMALVSQIREEQFPEKQDAQPQKI